MQPFFFGATIHHPDLSAAPGAFPDALALVLGMVPAITGEGITA